MRPGKTLCLSAKAVGGGDTVFIYAMNSKDVSQQWALLRLPTIDAYLYTNGLVTAQRLPRKALHIKL